MGEIISMTELREFLVSLMIPKTEEERRKIVIWCIDEADGVAKNYEDTLQFRRALKEEVKKQYPSIED